MHVWIPADLAETVKFFKQEYGKKYGQALREAMVLSKSQLEEKYKKEQEALR